LRYKAYGYRKRKKKERFEYATHISQRDMCVERRERNEDWELDTVIGKDHKSSLLTCTSRRSRYLEIRRLQKTSATEVVSAMVDIGKYQKILTTTSDRGSEFAYFRTLESILGIQSYMTSPYAAREK
jgi:IS30 family transposase